MPIYGLYYYVRDILGLRWRRWLTQHFLTRYFSGRAYYRLNADAGIDNPDQRIAEDINSFTQQSLYFSMIVLSSVIQLVAFASVLWTISPGPGVLPAGLCPGHHRLHGHGVRAAG